MGESEEERPAGTSGTGEEDRTPEGEASREEDAPPRGSRDGSAPAPDGDEAAPPGDRGATAEAESDHLSEEIRQELEELDELRDRHLRLAAEFENFRKRTRREMAEARERAQADLAGRLLDALDDLERVLESPADSTSAEALHEGIEMVHRKIRKELGEAGLSKMDARGERFDPEYHEALLTTPVDDPEDADMISRVLINGYTFGDRVLRPARVAVTKYAEAADGAASENPDEDDGAEDDGNG